MARAKARVLDYKRVFGSQAGQRVLNDLIQSHGILHPLFDPTQPNVHIFREGERNVVLRILKKLNTDPEAFQNRLKEIERNAQDI